MVWLWWSCHQSDDLSVSINLHQFEHLWNFYDAFKWSIQASYVTCSRTGLYYVTKDRGFEENAKSAISNSSFGNEWGKENSCSVLYDWQQGVVMMATSDDKVCNFTNLFSVIWFVDDTSFSRFMWFIHLYSSGLHYQWPLLLTWFNFNPSMDM